MPIVISPIGCVGAKLFCIHRIAELYNIFADCRSSIFSVIEPTITVIDRVDCDSGTKKKEKRTTTVVTVKMNYNGEWSRTCCACLPHISRLHDASYIQCPHVRHMCDIHCYRVCVCIRQCVRVRCFPLTFQR